MSQPRQLRTGPVGPLSAAGNRGYHPDVGDPESVEGAARCLSLLPLLLLILLGLFIHRETLDYELLGYDSYPLILTSQIQSPTDFLGTFTELMMEGRYPGGLFYRPTQQLLLAAEHTVWGLEPFYYHLTTLCLFAICVAVLYLLVRRLLGPRRWIGPTVAALVFVLHPSVLSVLPVVARRVELLAVLFTLAALWVLPIGGNRLGPGRLTLLALFVWLAAGSKEVGYISVGLVFLHQLLFTGSGGLAGKLRSVIPATGVALSAFAAHFAIRSWVIYGATHGESWIGGRPMGGDTPVSLASSFAVTARHFARYTLCPWRFERGPLAGYEPELLALAAAALLFGLAVASAVGGRVKRAEGDGRPARVIVLGITWVAAHVIANRFAGEFNPRYVMPASLGVGMMLAGVVELTRAMMRAGTAGRVAGAVSVSAVALILITALHTTPMLVDYPDWRGASRLQRAFLKDTRVKLEAARPGQRVFEQQFPYMPHVHHGSNPFTDRPHVDNAVMLAQWTLEAWAELVFPEKTVNVFPLSYLGRLPRPKPDEIQYVFSLTKAGPGQYRDIRPFGRLPPPKR